MGQPEGALGVEPRDRPSEDRPVRLPKHNDRRRQHLSDLSPAQSVRRSREVGGPLQEAPARHPELASGYQTAPVSRLREEGLLLDEERKAPVPENRDDE